jgi:hypothetical protein
MIPTAWLYRILGAALAVGALLWLVQSRGHWRDEARANATLFHAEQAAHAATVANYRAAAEQARKADAANLARVKAEQSAINERTRDDYETRIAAARARAGELRRHAEATAPDSGLGRSAPMPRLPASARGAPEAAVQSRFPDADRLIATEQAIQLDELVKWVRQQHAVRPDISPNGAKPE